MPFVYSDWAAAYPTLAASVPEARAVSYYNRALLIFDPAIVADAGRGTALAYLLVAHYAFLGGAGGGTAGVVGRVSKATEGSVSIETDYGSPSQGAAWYLQTPYGAEFWQATLSLRSATYRPGPVPNFEPAYGAYGRAWGRGLWK